MPAAQAWNQRARKIRVASLTAAVAALPAFTQAATTNYTAGDGASPSSWSQPTNWSAGIPSSTNTIANIVSTSPTIYAVNYDYTGVSVTLSTLTVSLTNGGAVATDSLLVSSVITTLNSSDILLGSSGGSSGSGTLNQTAGTVNPGSITLGNSLNDRGFYSLSGTGNLINDANGLILGFSGTGTFTQSGGAATLASVSGNSGLYLGFNSTGVGNYALSAGSLVSNSFEFIGYSGTGNFNQTGGTNTTPSIMYIGFGTNSNGNYTLTNNGTLSTNAEFVGGASTGSFVQSGSSTNTTTELAIGGDGNTAIGSYSLSGSATVGTNSGGVEIVGYGGTGAFTQSGGTNNPTGPLYVGGFTPIIGTGFYNLSNGQINASNGETIGNLGTGTFTQTGGVNALTNTASGLSVGGGSVGTYNLGGNGQIINSGFQYVGASATGAFNQTGGTNSINGADAGGGALYLGLNLGSTGTYTLSGGSLSLTASGAEVIGSAGKGIFIQSGGTNSAPGGTVIGESTGGIGIYSLSGTGSITTLVEQIGFASTGSFVQTGGTNTLASGLVVGYLNGISGNYALSGTGVLTASNDEEVIGFLGTGTFTQTGGTNNIGAGGLLVLGSGDNVASGTYLLSGGILNCAGTMGIFVGGGNSSAEGTGVLSVSGSGVINNSGTLVLYNTPGSGITLAGGTINTAALDLNGSRPLFNWVSGTLGLIGNVTFDSAAAPATTSAAFGSGLTLGSGQTLTVSANETLGGAGSFALTLNTGSAHYVTNGITLTPDGALNLNGGALFYQSLTQAGGAINGTLQNQGSFIYQSGPFNGRLVNQGNVSISGFGLTLSNGMENDTFVTISSGQTLTVNGSGLDNLGDFNLEGGAISGSGPVLNDFGGNLNGFGAINSSFTNQGVLTLEGVLRFNAAGPALNNGTLDGNGTIIGNFTNTVNGSIQVQNGELLSINTAWSNAGVTTLQGGTAMLQGAPITNTGTLQGSGAIGSAVTNSTGIIRAQGGELDLLRTATNGASAQIEALSNSTVLFSAGLSSNAGTISLSGGTFDNNNQPITNTAAGEIIGSGTFRSGTLTNNGTVYLFGASTVAGSVINAASANIHLGGTLPNTFTGPVSNSGIVTVDPGASGSFFGPYTGSGSIVNNGSLYINATSISGPISGGGTLTLGSAGTPNTLQLASLSADSVQAGLTIDSQSTLDLTNNALTLNYGSAAKDPAATIVNEIRQGYNNGLWTGTGITSTAAALNPRQFAVGYADGNIDPGTPAGANQLLVQYTLAGDANLDGTVDFPDLVSLAQNFSFTGKDWAEGNFTYDPNGSIGFADLVLLAQNFGDSTTVASAGGGLNLSPAWQSLQATAVPEPGTMLLLLPVCGLMARRRRR